MVNISSMRLKKEKLWVCTGLPDLDHAKFLGVRPSFLFSALGGEK